MNQLKNVELFLERSFNKTMKGFSGRGALNTKIRIVDNVIFVKMKVEYTGLEKNMFRYILSKQEDAGGYYLSIREESEAIVIKVLSEIATLNVAAISHTFDTDNELALTLIVLGEDLEKLIKEGKITSPLQCQVIPRT